MEHRENDVDRYYNDTLSPPPYVAPAKTNSKSIVSLVLGILSLTIPYLGFLIGIVAIIFASLAFKEIRIRMEQGKGLAIAGLVCGIIGTAIYTVLIVLFLFVTMIFVGADSYSTY
ncbi:DUF4190 domain-containing protein [Paenibacillus amylolyticus]|uniref:DUF4190 domain-containing protein n=1 Tax=Paenibacillus amylolyticus TaxID=1451 RepID=A0A117I3A3_PAEAM|nr:DUF4190 domain-containing protein [Paenibacillus amylolyticus]GAS85024.1 unknown protein [Paenibacillus amylolyticus]